MADDTVRIWLWVMLVISIPAILTVLYAGLLPAAASLDTGYKIAILICTFGLIIQCIRSVHFFTYGHYPIDYLFPLWITKDIGIVILIFRFVQRAKIKSNQSQQQKPVRSVAVKRKKAVKS